jgi:hypothetical protein
MKRNILFLIIAVVLWVTGCSEVPEATGPIEDLSITSTSLETTSRIFGNMLPYVNRLSYPVDEEATDGVEIVDCWIAGGGGWIWYTPEDYVFTAGDTVETVRYFINDEICDIQFTDAFYSCDETNWRHYLMTNTIDAGIIPPPPPGYGWIFGVGYIAPSVRDTVCRAWTSRISCNESHDSCGWPPIKITLVP